MVDPVAVVSTAVAGLNPSQPTGEPHSVGFTDWLGQHLASANSQLVQADDGVRKLALGEADNLHQVMINLEKAKLSFELVVQVRNKLLDAYQELMRMQI
jgi:flagellar hook-basal body complex protein FliE